MLLKHGRAGSEAIAPAPAPAPASAPAPAPALLARTRARARARAGAEIPVSPLFLAIALFACLVWAIVYMFKKGNGSKNSSGDIL